MMSRRHRIALAALLLLAATQAGAAGKLLIEHAWIRSAPPGAMMLAGYATLRNAGDTALTIAAAGSEDFGSVSLHQTIAENGVERMRPLGDIEIAAGASVEFSPGGKHFMLMKPQRELNAGMRVRIHISTKDGRVAAAADFIVAESAP